MPGRRLHTALVLDIIIVPFAGLSSPLHKQGRKYRDKDNMHCGAGNQNKTNVV